LSRSLDEHAVSPSNAASVRDETVTKMRCGIRGRYRLRAPVGAHLRFSP
jgi:hypothetical protein